MNPKISKKMDMVKEVFLRNKLHTDILQLLEGDYYFDDGKLRSGTPNLQLLSENKKRTKKYKGSKVRIKNNKGEFVDIGRQKNDIPDSGMIEVQPDDSSKLIQIGGLCGWDEGRQIVQKFKKGKRSFRDFQGRRIGIDRRLKKSFRKLGELDLVL